METRSLRLWSPMLVLATALAAGGCESSPESPPTGPVPPGTSATVTYWQDVAPIYNQRCVSCHQAGGIGPFRLDTYATRGRWRRRRWPRSSSAGCPRG